MKPGALPRGPKEVKPAACEGLQSKAMKDRTCLALLRRPKVGETWSASRAQEPAAACEGCKVGEA